MLADVRIVCGNWQQMATEANDERGKSLRISSGSRNWRGSQVVRPRSAKPLFEGPIPPLPPTRNRKVQELARAHPLPSFVGALRQLGYGPSPLSSLYEAVLFVATPHPP